MLSYIGAYTVKVFVYCFVGVTQNEYSQAVQIVVADFIFADALLFSVLRTVQFNNQRGRSTVKINDIRSDYFLTVDRNGYFF